MGISRGSGRLKNRIILLAAYFALANFIIYLTSGEGDRTSAPFVGLYSWAFIIARKYSMSIIGALLVFAAYLSCLFVLTTLLSFRKNIRSPVLPIFFHIMGSVMASLSYGPLDKNESPGLFLFNLILFLAAASLYLIADWRLADLTVSKKANRPGRR